MGNKKIKNRKYPQNTLYRDNKEYRSRLKKLSRERYHNDPEYRKATLERAKKRYHEDEEYRASTIRRVKERRLRLKEENKNSNTKNT